MKKLVDLYLSSKQHT